MGRSAGPAARLMLTGQGLVRLVPPLLPRVAQLEADGRSGSGSGVFISFQYSHVAKEQGNKPKPQQGLRRARRGGPSRSLESCETPKRDVHDQWPSAVPQERPASAPRAAAPTGGVAAGKLSGRGEEAGSSRHLAIGTAMRAWHISLHAGGVQAGMVQGSQWIVQRCRAMFHGTARWL